jgi:hypothetical protein
MGSQSYEIWQDTGNVDFPFQLVDGSYTPVGISATYSIAQSERFRYWLGSTERGPAVVWQETGWGSPNRVSNHAIEAAIQGYLEAGESVSDAVGLVKQYVGHYFYELHFPSVRTVNGRPRGATWVYDETSSTQLGHPQWHEKAAWDGDWLADRVRSHTYVDDWGKHLVGDHTTGDIYEEAMSLYDDAGKELRFMRSAPWVGNEQERLFFSDLILDMQVGGVSNLVAGNTRVPQVCLQISDVGGFTWSDEIWVGAGMTGEYKARAIWNRLGASWNRCFRVVISDPIQRCLVDAFLTVNPGKQTSKGTFTTGAPGPGKPAWWNPALP